MNIGVYVPFQIKVFSFPDICLGVGLPEYMAALFLVNKEPVSLLFIVATQIYIPISSVGGFPFLHTLSSIYYLCAF